MQATARKKLRWFKASKSERGSMRLPPRAVFPSEVTEHAVVLCAECHKPMEVPARAVILDGILIHGTCGKKS